MCLNRKSVTGGFRLRTFSETRALARRRFRYSQYRGFSVEVPPPGVGGMVVRRGGKKGKQGRRETVSGNGTHYPPPLFPLSPHLRVRTIPRT